VCVFRTVPTGLLRRDRLALAFALTLAAPALAAGPETPTDAARSHLETGRALSKRREDDAALAALDQALSLVSGQSDPRLAGEIQSARGLVLFRKSDWTRMGEAYQAAAAFFHRAQAFREEARALRGLTFSPALAWDERERLMARAIAVLLREPDPEVEGLVLHHWGDILFNQGRYGRALEKLEEARAKMEGSADDSSRARLLTSIGRTLRLHGQREAALDRYREALRLQTRQGDLAGAAQSENAIAVALKYLHRPREAVAHSTRALALAEKSGDAALIAFNRVSLGYLLTDAGDHRRALTLLAIEDPALSPLDEGTRRSGLAEANRALGRHREALEHAEAAVAHSRAVGDPYKLVFALDVRARSHASFGRPAEARRDSLEAISVLEGMRSSLAAQDDARQEFAEGYVRIYTTAISLLLRAGRNLEALEVTERARARAFLDLLATRDLVPGPSEAERDAARRQLATAAPIAGEAIRGILARLRSTLVAYWVGPEATVAWVVTPDGRVHARRLPLAASRLRRLTGALAAAASRPAGGPDDPARALYDQILKPVEAWLPARPGGRVTVVPHGPLFSVPFATLRDAQGRYVVERWATHYATSLSVLDRLEVRGEGGRTRGALVVADPAIDPGLAEREGLVPLPEAREEAGAVARQLGAAATTILSGTAATLSTVGQAAAASSVVHFATHAVVSDTRPLESFLALTPGDGSDGRLRSADVYGWRLAADLVVLSACRTARGRVNGDGVIGLSRAFAYAGAPSLVATVWDAPDQTSRELFPVFYAEWQRTGDRAGALRTAQLALIEKLREGRVVVPTAAGPVTLRERPALWAPFVLLGEP
jgi:CHAT domain-containing protein